MTDKDVLFKKVDDTTNVDLSSFCYFGWKGTGAFAFYKYACAYYDSAVSLYEKIQNSNGHYDIVDGLGIAMCFAYRHYTELMIKHLYVKFVCKDEADYKRFLSIGHNLVELWNNTKPKLKELKDRVGSSVRLGVVEHYIKQINAFDKESMSMRYPIDKKLSPMHPQTRLDLANLVERMNELYFAFEALAHDLDNQLNCEMDQEEITAFLAVYESLKPRVKQILIDLAKYAKKDKEIQMFHLGTFEDLQIEEDSSWNYLKGLTDDELILCDTLYYTGRTIDEGQLHLPVATNEASQDAVMFCILNMHRDGLSFGNPKNDAINIYGKQASSLIREIKRAMDVIDNK